MTGINIDAFAVIYVSVTAATAEDLELITYYFT